MCTSGNEFLTVLLPTAECIVGKFLFHDRSVTVVSGYISKVCKNDCPVQHSTWNPHTFPHHDVFRTQKWEKTFTKTMKGTQSRWSLPVINKLRPIYKSTNSFSFTAKIYLSVKCPSAPSEFAKSSLKCAGIYLVFDLFTFHSAAISLIMASCDEHSPGY